MDGWMDGWMDGRMDGWMDGCLSLSLSLRSNESRPETWTRSAGDLFQRIMVVGK